MADQTDPIEPTVPEEEQADHTGKFAWHEGDLTIVKPGTGKTLQELLDEIPDPEESE